MTALTPATCEHILAETLGRQSTASARQRVRHMEAVTGGDINQCLRLVTDSGQFFLKLNQRQRVKAFCAEKAGLDAIAATATIATCEALGWGQHEQYCYLLLQYLPLQAQGDWSLAGRQLALMHASVQNQSQRQVYGFAQPSYCGGSLQNNHFNDNWADFFARQRIGPQLANLRQQTEQHPQIVSAVNGIRSLLQGHQPQASLLHGDLWRGNIGFSGARPVIFDPAIYIGDSETDLAMTELFGPLPAAFYQGYRSLRAIAGDYPARRPIYQLYHLLNHANLFGGHYRAQAEQTLSALLSRKTL